VLARPRAWLGAEMGCGDGFEGLMAGYGFAQSVNAYLVRGLGFFRSWSEGRSDGHRL
jgi:hypothetical protein